MSLLVLSLGTRVLDTNDAARFPMLARDILSNGNWLLPRLDGVPHLNKPPFHAWLIALASWPTGTVTPWTAFVPSVLAAVVVVLLTYRTGRLLFDSETGLVAGTVALTTYGIFFFAHESVPDMVFCAAITGAIAAYAVAEFEGRRSAVVIFYILTGVAFWTKGPAGLLPIPVVGIYLWASEGLGGLRRLRSAPGMLALALVICSWGGLIAIASQGEQFVHDVLIRDLLQWYFPDKLPSLHQLIQPPQQALTVLLPWTILLPGAIWVAGRSVDSEGGRRMRWLLLWLGVIFVLAAITREQRTRYYLPLCPPAALLVAAGYSRLRSPRRALGFACLSLLVVAGGLTYDTYTRAQHNASTDLRAASLDLVRSTHLYAFDAPELVFSFYLKRPVTILPSYADYQHRIQHGDDGYLIVSERAVPTPLPQPLERVSEALVNRRRISILGTAPHLGSIARNETAQAAVDGRER